MKTGAHDPIWFSPEKLEQSLHDFVDNTSGSLTKAINDGNEGNRLCHCSAEATKTIGVEHNGTKPLRIEPRTHVDHWTGESPNRPLLAPMVSQRTITYLGRLGLARNGREESGPSEKS